MAFDNLIAATLASFETLGCEPLSLPDSFARNERAEVDGTLILETHFMAIANKGELRWVHINAPKISVLTLFFFPQARWQLPVYCMELVVFNAQPIVAMLDMLCLSAMDCKTQVLQLLTDAHAKHHQLTQASQTPDWFNECRSGLDFFIRPQHLEEMQQLSDVHLELLKPLQNLIEHAQAFSEVDAQQHHANLQAYKNHHRIHAPGLRLMNRSFGEQWTDDYMNTLFN